MTYQFQAPDSIDWSVSVRTILEDNDKQKQAKRFALKVGSSLGIGPWACCLFIVGSFNDCVARNPLVGE